MKAFKMFTISFLSLSFLLITSPANAIKPDSLTPDCADLVTGIDCETELGALCAATDAADSLKARDENTLVSKVLGAGTKIDQGKVEDADWKLTNYESKLDQLIGTRVIPAKAKISEDDADDLSTALTAAQMCVDGLLP